MSNQDRSDFDEGAFTDFHAYLRETFPRLHATLQREVLGDPRAYSLLYTWTGRDPSLPPVVLMAHLDVVPVVPETEDQWEHDAFSGDIADGYVWGRGSLDDKVMVLAIMEAVEMRLAEGFQPTRTTYLAFGQDEEVGGPEGVRAHRQGAAGTGGHGGRPRDRRGPARHGGTLPGYPRPDRADRHHGEGLPDPRAQGGRPGRALGDAARELQHRDPRHGDHEGRGEPVPVPGDAGRARPDALPRAEPARELARDARRRGVRGRTRAAPPTSSSSPR